MLENFFYYFRSFAFIFLCFLFCSFYKTAGESSCRFIDSAAQLCIRTEEGKVKSIETIPMNRISPVQAFYFYPEGGLLAHINWQDAFSIYFSEQGLLEEIYFQEEYKAFRNEREVVDCRRGRCISTEHQLSSIPAQELETGDIIFTGDLSPYTGLRGGELTHVSIFAGLRDEKPYIVTNDVYEFPEIEPLDEALKNTHAYVILRNDKFREEFQKFLAGERPQLRKRFSFCSLLVFLLYQEAFERKGAAWPYFERIFPEYLLQNILADFKVVSFHSQHYQSVAEMLQARESDLLIIHKNWIKIVNDPEDTLYQMFLNRFPILPVEFESDRVESLMRLTASGLFNASQEFTGERMGIDVPKKTPEVGRKGTKKGIQQYKIQNSPRLRRMDYENGETRLIEIYSEGGDCPDLAVYLRKGGYLSHIINWKAKYYFYFDEQGELIESLIDGEYRRYHQSKLVTTCSKNLCKSQEFEFLSLPKTNLQTGDVIFSANLYPYSGRGLSPITHIEIVSGIKNGSPMVLTNDISAPLKNLPLESTSTNRFTYLVARNQDFAQVFGDFIRNTTDSQALPVPYFCTNL